MNRYNISKRQTAMGRFGQMAAVLSVISFTPPLPSHEEFAENFSPFCSLPFPISTSRHHVSVAQLAQIAAKIPTIAIITGDEDALINTKRSEELHRELSVRLTNVSFLS